MGGFGDYFRMLNLQEDAIKMENSVEKLNRRLDNERQEFMELVLALRATFAQSNGRIPYQPLDAFIKKTWPHMEVKWKDD